MVKTGGAERSKKIPYADAGRTRSMLITLETYLLHRARHEAYDLAVKMTALHNRDTLGCASLHSIYEG